MKRRFGHSRDADHQADVEYESHRRKECTKIQRHRIGILIICLLVTAVVVISVVKNTAWHYSPVVKPVSVSVSYAPPSNVTNKLLATFEKLISSTELSLPPGQNHVPLILSYDGTILCRRSHKDVISKARIRSYIEMLNIGLPFSNDDAFKKTNNESSGLGLPIMISEDDNSGCYPNFVDRTSFPRLTWSTPSPKYGHGWCGAIGMPCYESWNAYRDKPADRGDMWWFFDYTSWDHTFKRNEKRYPWSSKIDKAVWRGSTTYPVFYAEAYVSTVGMPAFNFSEIPRAKLVKQSMERPDLIDAGFTSFVQDWESRKEELVEQTIVAKLIPFDAQMKYRAIIDIDGNSWSSRFTKLLCSNSVVIKIDPDCIEYFYVDLKPMVHYVPASLENVTEVASYVLDKKNRHEMKAIVDSANVWCKRTNTKEQLPRDAISQLEKYEAAIYDAYNSSWVGEWRHVRTRISKYIGDDLVDCNF